MTSEIRETIVEPLANGGFSVQLHISDKPKDAADASFRLILLATLPAPKRAPLHVQIQREAIRKAQEALRQ